MHQGGEPRILLSFCRLSYLFQRTGRVGPAQSPERVLLAQVPLRQTPSLHLLRRPVFSLVRRLLRYYGSVRLPVFVHHRLLSLDFPIRPESTASRANAGSPGSRARCILTCPGSTTARDSVASRIDDAPDVTFRLPPCPLRPGVYDVQPFNPLPR